MKPAFERTPQRSWESFHCEVVRGSSYNATWHFHPEIQITLVLKSTGYRLVGDNITRLQAGDTVLLGPNLPHVWHQEEEARKNPDAVHAVIVRFLPTFLGPGFLEIPEMSGVKRLLARARRGLHVKGVTRDTIAAMMMLLPELSDLHRVASLLSILQVLADSETLHPIASPGFVPEVSHQDQQRLERILTYLHNNLDQPLGRAVMAKQAHMNETAFSRFFKVRTGKTLPQYVNEVRVGRACRLLADEDRKVIDIAMQCGFLNLANFNRKFLSITGFSPRDYRRRLRKSLTP